MDLRHLFTDLVRVQIVLWNGVDARLRADAGIPLGTFETLDVLTVRGACRVQDIADVVVVTVGGVSKIVDRIERQGLCRRRSNPDDRRSSLVELTPEGSRVHGIASAIVDDELAARLGGALDPAALADLARTLQTLRSAGGLRPAPESEPASEPAPAPEPASTPESEPAASPAATRKAN